VTRSIDAPQWPRCEQLQANNSWQAKAATTIVEAAAVDLFIVYLLFILHHTIVILLLQELIPCLFVNTWHCLLLFFFVA